MKLESNKYYSIVCMSENYIFTWYKNKVYLGKRVLVAYNKISNKENYCIVEIKHIERVNEQ